MKSWGKFSFRSVAAALLLTWASVQTAKSQAPYCTPNTTNPCSQSGTQGIATNDVINSFWTTGGITNINNQNSGCNSQCSPANYTFFSPIANRVLTVARGQAFQVHVQCGITYSQGFAVWVDWNQNNAYSAAEMVYQSGVAGFQVFNSNNINVPNTALCGPTRLRVRSLFAGVPTDPCANQIFGEVEEYTVVVVGNPQTPVPTVTDTSVCQNGNLLLSASGGGTYSWFSGPTGNTPIGTGATFQTGTINRDTSFFVQNIANNCVSRRVELKVKVGIQRIPVVTPDSVDICEGDTAHFHATMPGIPGILRMFRRNIPAGCQQNIPDDVIAHPSSAFVNSINVSTIYPEVLTPLNLSMLVEVGVRLNHSRNGDVKVTLIAPNGSAQILTNQVGGSGANYGTGATAATYVFARFRRENTNPYVNTITNGNLSAVYRPSPLGPGAANPASYIPFNSLVGSPVNGLWQLKVEDMLPQNDNGKVLSWYMIFKRSAPDSVITWTPMNYLSNFSPTDSLNPIFTAPAVAADSSLNVVFTVRDRRGCFSEIPVDVDIHPTPTVTVTPDPAEVCDGQSINLAGGPGLDTLFLSPNIGLTQLDTLHWIAQPPNTTTYTAIGVSPWGCRDTISFPVTVHPIPAVPTITASGPTTFCQGGTVTLTSSAGDTYQWSNGATTQSITVSASGSFSLTVTSTEGCISAVSQATVVTVNPNPSTPVITSSGPLTFCQGGSVQLSASGTGSFLWSNGSSTSSITVSASGTFTVVVTDVNLCVSPISLPTVVTVNPLPPTPVITANGPTSFCSGGSVTLTAPTSASYLWNPGPQPSVPSITVNNPGNYTVVVTDNNGCTSAISAPLVVTVFQLPAAPAINSPGNVSSICQGESLTLTSTPSVQYLWNTTPPQTTQSITVNSTGNYVVTVTDGNGCTSSPSTPFGVTVNPLPAQPVISANGPLVFCDGNQVVLSTVPAVGYTWSNGLNSNTITITQSETITVIITDANGCVSPASNPVAVTVNPNPPMPIPVASGPLSFCDGGNVVLTINDPGSILWSNGATTSSITVSATGVFTATVTTAAGCISPASTPIGVVEFPPVVPPVVTPAGPTSFCIGNGISLSSSAGASYLWQPGGQTTQNIFVTDAGPYTVTVVDLNGCPTGTSAPIALTIFPLPPAPSISASGPLTFCQGGSVTLTSTSGVGYAWNTGATTQSITVSASGVYSVQISDANGCSSAFSTSVTVVVNQTPPMPSISASGPLTFCAGETVALFASNSISYQWSTGATTQSVVIANSGTYSVTVIDACSISHSLSVQVTVLDRPTADFTEDVRSGCMPHTVQFSNQSSGYDQLFWDFGDNLQSGQNNPLHTYLLPGDYKVTLVAVASNGCVDKKAKDAWVSVHPIPVADFQATPQPTDIEHPDVTLVNLTTDGKDYEWLIGGTDTSFALHPTHTFSDTGTFRVELRAVSPFGCRDSVVKTVRIDGTFIIYVANAFSPNQDGVNETYGPKGTYISEKEYLFEIFDRWGQRVFFTRDLEQGWDGLVGGQRGMTGVYHWHLNCRDTSGGKHTLKGSVTLIY